MERMIRGLRVREKSGAGWLESKMGMFARECRVAQHRRRSRASWGRKYETGETDGKKRPAGLTNGVCAKNPGLVSGWRRLEDMG